MFQLSQLVKFLLRLFALIQYSDDTFSDVILFIDHVIFLAFLKVLGSLRKFLFLLSFEVPCKPVLSLIVIVVAVFIDFILFGIGITLVISIFKHHLLLI